MNKKKDSEIAKIRRDLDDKNIVHEDQLAAQRKRNNDQIAELTLNLETLQKSKVVRIQARPFETDRKEAHINQNNTVPIRKIFSSSLSEYEHTTEELNVHFPDNLKNEPEKLDL